ncbi:MAG: recombination-associated protein RdgC [Betaproteobacteria bacterium]
MWFKNLQLYRLPKNLALTSDKLEEMLSAATLQPCNATDPQSIGWVAPSTGGSLVHSVNQQWLLALGIEQKLLPSSVIKHFVQERAKAVEESEGRRVGRKEMREMSESLTLELLPRAFIRRRTTFGWIDPLNGWLVIDAASPAKAEEFIEHLHKSVEGLYASLLKTIQSPSAAMTSWVDTGEAPTGFTIDQDIELRSAEDAVIRYARHTLEGKEIQQHIAEGKVVTRLGLTWGDRISFLLDEKHKIKRLEFLDILKEQSDSQAENEDERFDLDFTLMSGELARLLNDLVESLGGELEKV